MEGDADQRMGRGMPKDAAHVRIEAVVLEKDGGGLPGPRINPQKRPRPSRLPRPDRQNLIEPIPGGDHLVAVEVER